MFTVARGGVIHKYYKLFKEKKHNLKIATIFTYNVNEDSSEKELSQDLLDSYMQDYNEMFDTNFTTDDFKGYHADVSKRMKNREIDLLLVVDMFLTGFDSPLLNTLYVDKDLKYHTLLQAFSRTNRIVNMRKSQGNIVCFRDIKEDTDRAIALFSMTDNQEDIIIPDMKFFVDKFNEAVKEFRKLVTTVEEALNLQTIEDKKTFVLNFRELSRIKNKLDIYTEFSFDKLDMTEQEFNDYKSVYFSIYDEVRIDPGEKVSILDDIDFELELLRNDQINVDYIIKLMEDLDFSSVSFNHDKERILKLVNETQQLRSKIDLIEKFINEKLGNIDRKQTTVGDAFDEFMRAERRAEICNIIDDENLDESKAREFFKEYEFSGKFDDDLIKQSFTDELKYKERKQKVKTIKNKVTELFDKFDY